MKEVNSDSIIKYFETVIQVGTVDVQLTLITMSRSFLLHLGEPEISARTGDTLTKEDIARKFMDANLKGLCMAIGQHSTCLIESDNSLASATMASRLSKKFNQDRPVYVANNVIVPQHELDSSDFIAKLYLKVFQFVGAHFTPGTARTGTL